MASRWLIILSLLLSALLLGLVGWHSWAWQHANDQMLSRRLQSINRVFTPSLAEAAQDEDMARVHKLLFRLTGDPAILNATLRDESGNVRDFTGSVPPPADLAILPTTLTTWSHDGIQRWIQPLEPFVSVESPHRYWLDLSLDPMRAAAAPEHPFNRWTPLLALLLLFPAVRVWRRSRQVENAARRQDESGAQALPRPAPSTPAQTPNHLNGDLAYVSHELRAPLSGVLGFCRLLENSPLDARQREWLRHIHLASNGLLDTVDQVLGDTRRCRADNVFDVAEVLWEVLCLQTPLAQSRHMTLLAIVYDDVPPRLVGADIGIRQLLTNLISNAIKYGAEGDVVIRVVLESREGSAVRLRLSVSDGGGIDPIHRERLKRAIERGRDGAVDAEAGVGIAICHRLVAEMNGYLALATRADRYLTVVANIGLEACEPYVRPAEFDLEGAEIELWQPHGRLAQLLDYALKRWQARPKSLTDPASLTAPSDSIQLSIIGIDETALAPETHRIWQQRFDAMTRPCLLIANIPPTLPLSWRLPRGSVVLRLPISRYSLGRTLAKMLAECRQHEASSRFRVLVVDDDPVSRHYLDAVLPLIGAEVVLAGTAAEAIAVASEHAIDLVLMDLHLPDASGFDATRRLRRLNREWAHKPIIAITAEPEANARHRLADGGINEMLTKPLDEQRLRDVLARYLPATAPEASALQSPAEPTPPGVASSESTAVETAPSETISPEKSSETVSFETVPIERATLISTRSGPATAGGSSTGRTPSPMSADPRKQPSLHAGDLPVVDKARAGRISGDRDALAEEMMGLLIADLPRYRHELNMAWRDGDVGQLGEIAHQLGGGCRYCGAIQLAAACARMESRCRRHSLDECGEAFHELMAACDRLAIWADDQTITDTR
ncbi:response regulator [Salinicola socius]|uniref:histidine kinase n=1 Tax=Salinicola socius TaxID=404433 RepID=A0A1Q8SW22_9GAMM|nr:response regulator [Salinicola socius]OLO05623.1 hypothetical protein BTW07_03905 [Salinicola socius]